MNPRLRSFMPAAALFAAGCASSPVTDSTGREGPVFGRQDETTFVAGADIGAAPLGDLARVARTIRKYKDLGAGDQEIVRRVAAMKFDGMVAGEMRRLAPSYERKKETVRRQSQARVAAVRRDAAAGRKPAGVAEREVAAVEADQSKEIAAIDAEWRSAARNAVVKSHGADFAVPVRNPDGKAVVAFASVRDSGITVSSAAYELAGARQALAAAAAAGRDVSHDGRAYALLDVEVPLR